LALRNAAQALEEEMRPTLSYEARQALFRAAHAECSVLMAAMLKRLVFFSIAANPK
jgi:hypothetical protein